jgi:S-adenosylmethionine:tRNA ribosyltransferase-isomerase
MPTTDLGAISSYDYQLPPELIASHPLAERDASRLLVVDRAAGTITHSMFRHLPDYLQSGDLLVRNETRVVPAKLKGERASTGGKWEGLFLGLEASGLWRLIGQTRGKLLPGESLSLTPADQPGSSERLQIVLKEKLSDGEWLAEPVMHREGEAPAEPQETLTPSPSSGGRGELEPWAATQSLLERFGTVPLPPYIERLTASPEDRERYQTTYARNPGAVAAPTAGLHFTPKIFARCREKGVEAASLTLHVGVGTFRPVSVVRLDDHVMHFERGELPADTAAAIQQTRSTGGRVVAIGTTAVRTLETVASRGQITAWSGETNLFIRPPYQFQVVDALVTNFHLPQSTLLVLVSALAGRELILEAYRQAIAERYRFFSYGDAMLIV